MEELARKGHTLTKELYQQAAYRAGTMPEAMPLAEEIRRRARQCVETTGGLRDLGELLRARRETKRRQVRENRC